MVRRQRAAGDRGLGPGLAAPQAGAPLPLMIRLPTSPANAPVPIVGQGVDQSTAAAGEPAGDDGPGMLLVAEMAASLTAAADPVVTE